jgi:uncharacterized radical SAM superfamily protein
MLEYFDLEYAIQGDGEAVMPEFINRIENRLPLAGLNGLIIRRENRIVQDNEPLRVQDLDSLPFPRPLRYLDLEKYRRFGSALQIQTKRGCTFKCSYCTYNRIEGKQYRLRSPKLVADEIEILVKETGINHIEFTDSIFNVPLLHAKEVLKELSRKNLELRLHTMGLSPSAIDEELLDLMKYTGFNEVDIGAESTCNIILESLGKDFQSNDIIKTANLLRNKKIPATWFMMLGAPSETIETVHESLNTIGKIVSKWDLVFISTGVRVYNGAPIADEMIKYDGNCTSDNFLHPVKIEPLNISLKDIHIIAKSFSFRFPNFYYYEKEHIIPGWILIIGNLLLKVLHSRQPVWRLLIFLKRIEYLMGISLLKRGFYELNLRSYKKKVQLKKGFSIIGKK